MKTLEEHNIRTGQEIDRQLELAKKAGVVCDDCGIEMNYVAAKSMTGGSYTPVFPNVYVNYESDKNSFASQTVKCPSCGKTGEKLKLNKGDE